MKTPSNSEHLDAERTSQNESDTRNLPRLRSLREKLQREAGELGVAEQRFQMVVITVGAIAGIVGAYTLWKTVMDEPPIVAVILTAVLGIALVGLAKFQQSQNRAREKKLSELHEKMRTIGRHIESAERRLRS